MLLGAGAYLLEAQRYAPRLRWRPAILVLICLCGTVPFSAARGAYWDAMIAVMSHVPIIHWGIPGLLSQGDVSLWHATAAVALVVLLSGWSAAQKVLSAPAFQFLGWISFPLYLVHIPVLCAAGCFAFLFAHEAGASYAVAVGVAFLVYLPAAFGTAAAMEWLVDRRAIKLAALASARLVSHRS